MIKRISSFAVSGLFMVIVLCVATVYAEEPYRTEITANYGRSDTNFDYRTSLYGISADIFFAPVNTDGHPYAEAAFLERIGSVRMNAANMDIESGPMEGKGPMFTVGVNYAQPGFPLAIQAMYIRSQLDYDSTFYTAETESSGYALSIGNYFTDALMAGVKYQHQKSDATSTNSLMGTQQSLSSKYIMYGLFAKYIKELAQSRALTVDGNLGRSKLEVSTDTESNTDMALSLDYFFIRSLSVGVGVENSSGDLDTMEGRTYSAKIRFFIVPQVSIQAGYNSFRNKSDGKYDSKSYDVALAARF